MQNYYTILGVSRRASQDEIKNAYRKLAKKYHPDSSGSREDKERFQEIQEAYAVLSNEKKRRTYDYYGHEAYRKSYYAQHADDTPDYGHDVHGGHGHCGGGCGGHEQGGCDGSCGGHEHGGCDGSCGGHEHGGFGGSHGGHGHDGYGGGHGEGDCDGDCENCGNHSEPAPFTETFKHVVRIAVWLEIEETFREVVKDAVLTERAYDSFAVFTKLEADKTWHFQVKIPANTYERQNFPLEDVIVGNEELIEYLHENYPDNCYVAIILLRDKPGYTRQAYHLYMDYPIDFHTLVLGGAIRISSVTGEFTFEVPAGTSLERKLRIPNMGLNYPPEIGVRGDLYLNLHLKIPRALTPAQKAALEQLRSAFAANQPEASAAEATSG